MALICFILPAKGKCWVANLRRSLFLCASVLLPSDQLADHLFRDGNIRYYEYDNDKFEFLSQYSSPDPQRGIAFMPKRGVDVSL